MRNQTFKCPICCSTHHEHIFPKNKETPVFLVRCSKCITYQGWIKKEYAYDWRRGNIGMECIKPTIDTKRKLYYCEILKELGAKQYMNTRFNLNDYIVDICTEVAKNKLSNKRFPIKIFLEKMITE